MTKNPRAILAGLTPEASSEASFYADHTADANTSTSPSGCTADLLGTAPEPESRERAEQPRLAVRQVDAGGDGSTDHALARQDVHLRYLIDGGQSTYARLRLVEAEAVKIITPLQAVIEALSGLPRRIETSSSINWGGGHRVIVFDANNTARVVDWPDWIVVRRVMYALECVAQETVPGPLKS